MWAGPRRHRTISNIPRHSSPLIKRLAYAALLAPSPVGSSSIIGPFRRLSSLGRLIAYLRIPRSSSMDIPVTSTAAALLYTSLNAGSKSLQRGGLLLPLRLTSFFLHNIASKLGASKFYIMRLNGYNPLFIDSHGLRYLGRFGASS